MDRKKKKSSAPVGRPPAPWVYELLRLDLPGDRLLDYYELSEKLGVTLRAVHGLCTQLDIPGQFYRKNITGIRKGFYYADLKSYVILYLKSRGRKEI